MINRYFTHLQELLALCETRNREALLQAASLASDSLAKGHLLHTFGTGHGALLAIEPFHRAGGLAQVDPIMDDNLTLHHNARSATFFERLSGYAEAVLAGRELHAGEEIIIASNSGRNAVPVEMAMLAQERGLKVIAITSLAHSQSQTSRHPSGKKLYELADVVLDNCAPLGDASIHIDGLNEAVSGVSTITGAALIQALTCQICEQLLVRGITPPVWISSNMDGGDAHNEKLQERYASRIRSM